jgi:hypothetical protein
VQQEDEPECEEGGGEKERNEDMKKCGKGKIGYE